MPSFGQHVIRNYPLGFRTLGHFPCRLERDNKSVDFTVIPRFDFHGECVAATSVR
jgi:hypothetical protein